MKPIIGNDLQNIYINIDFLLGEKTKLDAKATQGDSSITVINASGFSTDDYLIIGEVGDERSERVQISSISGTTIGINTTLDRNYDNKTKVSLLLYDQVKVYEGTSTIEEIQTRKLLTTLDGEYLTTSDGEFITVALDLAYTGELKNDYYNRLPVTITTTNYYQIKFVNSITEKTSPGSEIVYGYQRNLCGIADIYQFEDASNFDRKLINKIDIASQFIRNTFTNQDQDFTDLTTNEVELLRLPTALYALYYAWLELIKDEKDIASIKSKQYYNLASSKIEEVLKVISQGNDDVQIYGQTQMLR